MVEADFVDDQDVSAERVAAAVVRQDLLQGGIESGSCSASVNRLET